MTEKYKSLVWSGLALSVVVRLSGMQEYMGAAEEFR